MLKKFRIGDAAHPAFAEFWQIYQDSFPLHERRALEDQREVFQNDTYHLRGWEENGRMIGFLGWWTAPRFTFAEHYAIRPGLKSQGHGTRLFAEWLAEAPAPVILEIEPVVDDTTRRRLRFYQRLSFVENPWEHHQPPYHPGMAPVPLRLLSRPGAVSEETYRDFVRKQREEITPRAARNF